MKQFLENIIKNIVENPDQVIVDEAQGPDRITYTISVADGDMGRIIGKDGKVINAVRLIMRVMAIRQNTRVRVDIQDKPQDEGSTPVATEPETTVTEAPVAAPTPVETPSAPTTTSQVPTPSDIVGQPQQPVATTTIMDNSAPAVTPVDLEIDPTQS